MNDDSIFSSSSACEETSVQTIARGSCPAQLFCDGSASVPRGVVYHPVNLTGHTQNCPSGSSVLDVRGPPPTNCSKEEPTM